jgi:hypothetical protein
MPRGTKGAGKKKAKSKTPKLFATLSDYEADLEDQIRRAVQENERQDMMERVLEHKRLTDEGVQLRREQASHNTSLASLSAEEDRLQEEYPVAHADIARHMAENHRITAHIIARDYNSRTQHHDSEHARLHDHAIPHLQSRKAKHDAKAKSVTLKLFGGPLECPICDTTLRFGPALMQTECCRRLVHVHCLVDGHCPLCENTEYDEEYN